MAEKLWSIMTALPGNPTGVLPNCGHVVMQHQGPTHCVRGISHSLKKHRSFYLENSMVRLSKMKYEIVLKNETPRLKSTQLLGKSREQIRIALLLMTRPDQSYQKITTPHNTYNWNTERQQHEPRLTGSCKARNGTSQH